MNKENIDDMDYYEKYLLNVTKEERDCYIKEHPDFMNEYPVSYEHRELLQDKIYRGLMRKIRDYENRYLETHPGVYYEGVMDTLKELALEYPLFIVSNCQCGYIEVMMKGAGMEPYIKDFLCFGQTQTSKDQTILKLMEKNNLTSPVYVGDTQGDADSCKNAGIPFIFAAYGLGDVKEDYPTIHSFSELKTILRELD